MLQLHTFGSNSNFRFHASLLEISLNDLIKGAQRMIVLGDRDNTRFYRKNVEDAIAILSRLNAFGLTSCCDPQLWIILHRRQIDVASRTTVRFLISIRGILIEFPSLPRFCHPAEECVKIWFRFLFKYKRPLLVYFHRHFDHTSANPWRLASGTPQQQTPPSGEDCCPPTRREVQPHRPTLASCLGPASFRPSPAQEPHRAVRKSQAAMPLTKRTDPALPPRNRLLPAVKDCCPATNRIRAAPPIPAQRAGHSLLPPQPRRFPAPLAGRWPCGSF